MHAEAGLDVVLGCAVAENTDDVVITVGAPGALELAVLDEKGEPLLEPILYVDRERRRAVPGPGGVVHLELAPGNHILVVNVDGRRARAEIPFTIKSGEVTKLGTIQLQ